MICETIPVAQNMSYSTHSVRKAMVAQGAQERDYEIIEALPYQPYANVQPPSVTCEAIPVAQNKSYSTHSVRKAAVEHAGAQEGDYELIQRLPYQPYANVQPPSSI